METKTVPLAELEEIEQHARQMDGLGRGDSLRLIREVRRLAARVQELEPENVRLKEADGAEWAQACFEARDIACKLLQIAECRGPRVQGPRPPWLESLHSSSE